MIRDAGVVFVDLFIIILFLYVTHAEIGQVVLPTTLRLVAGASGQERREDVEADFVRIELSEEGRISVEGRVVRRAALWQIISERRVDSAMLLVDAGTPWVEAGPLIQEMAVRGFNVVLITSPAK